MKRVIDRFSETVKNTELLEKIDKLEKKINIALETLGQIAMYSNDKVDAVQATKAICDIKDVK